ncbi:MAG: tetratricopeptide repeat protein [Flavisolibacter sp.]|nr:tetratricopeptide repeat protein [Flavisolibacter sp.]
MKKSAIVLFSALFTISAFAQSVQDGLTHLYAERTQSAQTTFEKMLASNPNNVEAIYWLGQTHLANNDVAAARALYQKALTTTNNAPLIRAGMGQILLTEGKTAEGRQEFEAALTASKGKKGDDAMVLAAVGRANVEAYTEKDKHGDLDYAIAKLQQASQLAPNNADILVALGNAYRKKHEGGQAATQYLKAAQLNPNFALPYYRLAMLYKTQRNWDVVNTNLDKAIKADPKFAPAYLQQYEYQLLYKKDFGAAETLANQFISNADPSPENEYLRAQTLFMQGEKNKDVSKYDEAINIGKNILAKLGNKARPSLYRLLAYSNLAKGDTVAARPYVDQFFANVKGEDDIVPMDYLLKADVYMKENPDVVRQAIYQGIQTDTSLYNRVNFLNEVIDRARASGNKLLEADARLISYQLRGSQANPAELFQVGLPYYQAGQYQRADSVFKAYAAAMPDSVYGYYWSGNSLAAMDSTMSQGLAVEPYQKALEIAEKDKERESYKGIGVSTAGYLAGYYNNIKGDKSTAITYLQRGLQFDPTNTSLTNSLNALSKTPTKTATPKKGGETKVKTENGKTKIKKKA